MSRRPAPTPAPLPIPPQVLTIDPAHKLALDIEESAAMLSLGRTTFLAIVRDRKILPVHAKGRTIFARTELQRYLDENREQAS